MIIDKAKFISLANHELRTPLNAIIGFSGTLLMQLPGPLNKDQLEQVNIIKDSANHLLKMINGVMEIIKIEFNSLVIMFEQVDCQTLIKKTVSALSSMAEAKSIKLSIKHPRDIININTDPKILAEIINYLVNNGIKFTDKGEVIVELEKKLIKDKNYIIIHVIDTGVGIKPEDQVKLFQPFQMSDGLSLYLSQKLAELLHATIEVTSEYGKGSCFSLLLEEI